MARTMRMHFLLCFSCLICDSGVLGGPICVLACMCLRALKSFILNIELALGICFLPVEYECMIMYRIVPSTAVCHAFPDQ